MFTRLVGSRPPGAGLRPLLTGWLLLAFFLQSACVTDTPRGGFLGNYRDSPLTPPSASKEYVTRTPSSDFAPVQVSDAEFREAFTQLLLEIP